MLLLSFILNLILCKIFLLPVPSTQVISLFFESFILRDELCGLLQVLSIQAILIRKEELSFIFRHSLKKKKEKVCHELKNWQIKSYIDIK